MSPTGAVTAWAPGRVNLIGDHTDYMGGLVLPMAVQLGTTITAVRGGDRVELTSAQMPGKVTFPVPARHPDRVEPSWGRYVAGVAAELDAVVGIRGRVESDLPIGSGLSSSASLEVATALALGDTGDPAAVARRCQLAEQRATGVPCGIMDQLASAAGIAGHALLIDCSTLDIDPVPVPDEVAIWVIHSGQERGLVDSAYAQRRAECEAAAAMIGPLPHASEDEIEALSDPIMAARARHVRTECTRVVDFAAALRSGDLGAAGSLMVASHRSLRDDFEVSTDRLDALVDQLTSTRGVHGARLTGAGFGGCVVAMAEPGVDLGGWQVSASAGAHLSDEA
ncbi:MAG: galactokinase [Microthrixaceae bacterium]